MNGKAARHGFLIVTVLAVMTILVFSNFARSNIPSGGPYYLQVPTSTWTCQMGTFSNGTHYVVNGTNWKVDYKSISASQTLA